ncbi:BMP family ABC transporter substrate-binding protein [Aquibacillus koreensis]|uniref:BMP family ABC transporter substrate-binding protein n=1 Tax=Aquibacillus koreensis TaxID=279446 RepID=A0A9X4AJ40_9BACI|nr:BMP family ABC transporter substrate-binding protein [Aquibacillus koreensis]MCT2534584.1 BMP family ABC transporter substrate-binding protein [Aquibacillus koreensis]MDC3421822.1 BMP family ABC transporter substrate-binding protein [Aquibacillus koreensis]
MKKKHLLILFALLLSFVLVLSACGTADEDDSANPADDNTETEGTDETTNEGTEEQAEDTNFKVGMVTDTGGVDDKSFNQSAWEGLNAFGEANGLVEKENFDYVQSSSDADYSPNLNRLVQQDYNLIYGIGFLLMESVTKVAEQNPDTNFAIVDETIEGDNVVSIRFKEHQGSFLVGVAAAMKTKSKKVGFVGGVESELIKKFETGFEAGVKSVDPSIEVVAQYAESFGDATKGKAIAAGMYNSGADVIYHASGGTGNGVFNEAKDIKNADEDAYVWVIGVDRDQHEEGAIGDTNVTLTSMLKRVDVAVQNVTQQAYEGEFPGGETLEFGLEDDAIGIAETNEEAYTAEIDEKVQEFKQSILDGEIDVPSTDEELEAYLADL